MSVTVTYKGDTLTTVSNATKTLETQGTWMEDDLTLTDTTTRVASVDVTVSASRVSSISFAAEGEPTRLTIVLRDAGRGQFYSAVVSGVYDGTTCTFSRAALNSTTLDGVTTYGIRVNEFEGTFEYSNGTVTLTSSTSSYEYMFKMGTYTIIYSYEP